MTWRVIVGTVSMVVTMILLGYVAVTEQDRMASFTSSYESRQIEAGAALFENNCKTCHGDEGQGVPGKGPALNDASLFNGERLKEIVWTGTTDNFVRTTIAGGRPRATEKYKEFLERMPTWGEEFGGPLRKDQVDALVAFIMNWGSAYAGAAAAPTQAIEGVGADITLALPTGNADNGSTLAKAKACTACHIDAPTGPAWLASADPNKEGIGTRAQHRFKDQGYTGKATSAEQYLFEAIVQPNAYLVPGASYQANGNSLMPATFANTLTKQDAADIVAYMLTLK